MKKQNFKNLKLNKKSISNLKVETISGGRFTWINNTECCDSRNPRICEAPKSAECIPVTAVGCVTYQVNTNTVPIC